MTRNKFYYDIKPLVPVAIRRAVRGWLARDKVGKLGDVWPIYPGSERPPEGWPGWPDGRQFTFVLTHDVEGPLGLEKCRQLMELEMKHGFRSCFNFIPEGEYRVSRELREELAQNGFEVSLHDLHHDGRLYQDRARFVKNAARINDYLKEWGSVGFRSGFMFHELDWLQELEILYDTSTFDTDPFEPQPDGTGTIFPFWHERTPGRGYVEMPYTLPQDSTLFLLLRERSPSVWIKKTEWIARHRGMALLDVHPDYINFAGGPPRQSEYPMAYYEEFLQHVAKTYKDAYWNPLPKELAAWYKNATGKQALGRNGSAVKLNGAVANGNTAPTLSTKPKRICMVVYSDYEKDNRVMRYAEELARRGDTVEVLALRADGTGETTKMLNGVSVSGIQYRARKDEKTRGSFLWPLLRFSAVASAWVTLRHLRRPYDLVHVHNVPDFLVFTAWFPKLTGTKIILDIHDIVPEFYASKFNVAEDRSGVKMLKQMERMSAWFSHHVIISNHLWRDKYAGRTGTNARCTVFVNNVNSLIFSPRPRTRKDDKFIIIFPGGLQWHQGLDIALRAFQEVSREVPQAEFHIYGDGNMKQSLIALTKELGLENKVRFFDPIPVRSVVDVMANADLGVVPKRADSFGNEAYSTKIMEFMSLGIPVVVSSTKIDRFYFNDSVVRFFESGNADALAKAMLEMIRDRNLREGMARRASEYAQINSWDSRKADYLQLVDSLCANGHMNSAS